MSPLFGPKYNDELLCTRAEQALADNPVTGAAPLDVTSTRGVVTIRGRASSQLVRSTAVDVVRHAFQLANLKHDRIVEEITVGEQSAGRSARSEERP